MVDWNRREFLGALGMGASALALDPMGAHASAAAASAKPISGSWFEFQHHATVEGVDWNPALVRFTAEQWEAKVQEMCDIGMRYLVLMSTALYNRAFFPTSIFAPWQLACADPLEAVLAAADKRGARFFIGDGFYGDWKSPGIITDPAAAKKRRQAMEELVRRYGHHPSFYGWYWPNEASINPYFSDAFIAYVNAGSRLARQLTPQAKILIAPYGTRLARPDDAYIRQLDAMDVDIVAYQDEVGVGKSKVTETSAIFERLRRAHNRAQKARMWADMEIFEFQDGVYNSALMPAPFERVRRQIEALSPWVDEILAYQVLGMMNRPGSQAFAGAPESTQLYADYRRWLSAGRR